MGNHLNVQKRNYKAISCYLKAQVINLSLHKKVPRICRNLKCAFKKAQENNTLQFNEVINTYERPNTFHISNIVKCIYRHNKFVIRNVTNAIQDQQPIKRETIIVKEEN